MSAIPGNPQNRSTFQRRSDTPRKVRGGIKLAGTLLKRDTSEPSAGAELGLRFQTMWESTLEHDTIAAGLEYAKSGQIVDLDFRADTIQSHVQGTLPKPYLVQLKLPALSDEQWERAIQAMSGEAVYVAKLLAGELPAAIHDRLKDVGVQLLPESSGALSATCTCGAAVAQRDSGSARCKHIAAVTCIAAERLAEHPLLIFVLLGKSPEDVLERLRQARAGQTSTQSGTSQEFILSDSSIHAPPLEACIDDFWRSPVRSDEWNALQDPIGKHYVPHALLRRLGPSPMDGRFPLVGLLASVYDTVAAAARHIQEHPNQVSGVTDTDPNH